MKQAFILLISFSIYSTVIAQTDSTAYKSKVNLTETECPHLIFKFGNGMSRIPSLVFKKLNEARVEMSDFSKSSYALQKFTFTILYDETKTFVTFTNNGSTFTEKTKSLFNSVKPKDIIMVAGITAVDLSGKSTHIQERNFGLY